MTQNLAEIANENRIEILKMLNKAGSGHSGSSLSCIDIITTLYFGEVNGEPILKHDPRNPRWDERDFFVLSKGHGCPALYVVLAQRGYFPKEELNHLRQIDSLLQGHPNNKIPGIEVASGSLGQGLSAANGIALTLKWDGKPNRVFCIIGDGESQEGQIWEAAMTAGHHKLDNLICIQDRNGLQIDGEVARIKHIDPVRAKFEAFGWAVKIIENGHDYQEISEKLAWAMSVKNQPVMLIAKTIKGKGVSFMENAVGWHGIAPSDEELEQALAELSDNV